MKLSEVKVTKGTGMDCGSKRDAIAAYEKRLDFVGRGLCRTVYADARRRFVYKVENGQRWQGSNRDEYAAMMGGLQSRGLGYYATPAAVYTMPDGTDILCMPFRPGDAHEASHEERARFRERVAAKGGLPDMHDGNYRVTPNGRIRITDLGFGVDGRNW